MSMGKSNLQLCVDVLSDAWTRLRTGPACCHEAETLDMLVKAVSHLAQHCRLRVDDRLTQLEALIMSLTGRIEALETPANPRYAREDGECDEWQHLLDTIGSDSRVHGWTDTDALIAWRMGRAAMLQARFYSARFDHDAER